MESELRGPEYVHLHSDILAPLIGHSYLLGTTNSVVALEGHAPAANQWIIICGQRLYENSSQARGKWTAWKADLRWFAEQVGLTDTVKLRCQQALTQMKRIAA